MDDRTCPKCQRRLAFSGDGRTLICDYCGHRQPSGKKENFSVRDLIELERIGKQMPKSQDRRSSARIWLADGNAALQKERLGDAYFAYSFVLKTDATGQERGLAWLGLANVFEDSHDKRQCLEYALLNDPQLASASREIAILEGRLERTDIIDPNTVSASKSEMPLRATLHSFDCPQCGASIEHDPEEATLTCQFCGHSEQFVEGGTSAPKRQFGQGPFEQDFLAALATSQGHLQPVNQRSFDCQRCGTGFILDESTLSMTCPFCESAYVTEAVENQVEKRELMSPTAILPFLVSEAQATRIYRAWLKENLSKRQRSTLTRLGQPHAVYLPIWTFDIGGAISWKGFVEQNDRQVPVSGTEFPFFDDVIIPASDHYSKLIKTVMQPPDTEKMKEYKPSFLAGWPAERYTLPLADAALRARKEVVSHFRRKPFRLTKQRGVQRLSFQTSNLVVESFKLLYLSLWIGHYRIEKQEYEVYINGSTGVIDGEKPKSGLRGWIGELVG